MTHDVHRNGDPTSGIDGLLTRAAGDAAGSGGGSGRDPIRRARGMKLIELTRSLEGARLEGDGALDVHQIRSDSRAVEPGDLFVAVVGSRADGHDHLAAAIERGAAAVVVGLDADDPVLAEATVVRVPDTRRALGRLAAARCGWPAEELGLIGITGTNGKTTVSYLLEAVLAEAGHRPGVIGTVEYRRGAIRHPSPLTTPGPEILQEWLLEMTKEGLTHAVLEISSHAIDQERVAGCAFDVCVFTNISQDHLDYHGDMDAYFDAKARLFAAVGPAGAPRTAVVNLDDPRGAELADRSDAPVLGFGVDRATDVRASSRVLTRAGIRARIETPRGPLDLSSPLVGRHNLENLLAAAAAGVALELPLDAIERGLAGLARIPGRLDRVPASHDIDVFVDYAHTPDALERVLAAVRPFARGRVITVFGCGGDRDATKRAPMARAVLEGGDVAVATSDNPRTEDPGAILDDVVEGLAGGTRVEADALATAPARSYAVVLDRRSAIGAAIRAARPGDLVLIAGKGHEDYQVVGTERVRFDDREEAALVLRELQD